MSSQEAEAQHLNDIQSMRDVVTEAQTHIQEVVNLLEKKAKVANHQIPLSLGTSLAPQEKWATLFDPSFETISI